MGLILDCLVFDSKQNGLFGTARLMSLLDICKNTLLEDLL